VLRPFIGEAGRLNAFSPPFRFTRFFSPEDTLLCVCAASSASRLIRNEKLRIVELTTGSGLVGMSLLLAGEASTLLGLDVDEVAVETAAVNSRTLSIENRCQFECADLWSARTLEHVRGFDPHLIICNPPYVPEPVGLSLQLEAGAGADGTAHIMRTIELLAQVEPQSAALSWCSLSDPEKVVDAAHRAGYALDEVFIVAIADGEYSGSVHSYLRTLPHAYICELPRALLQIAPDGAARFAYLLMAGSFSRRESSNASALIGKLCSDFSAEGIEILCDGVPGIPTHCWVLDRWDELGLRAALH
jgi:16S rRNA G966 N2-methylase RsmD